MGSGDQKTGEKSWQRRDILSLLGAVPLLASSNAFAKVLNTAQVTATQPGNVATLAAADLVTGMKGYGLTVVKGTKVERFDIEIIGVLKKAMPQQDLILIRCAGLGLEHSGVVAGMSGSPIFVQHPQLGERLIGALSYGFPFNKDPVAGVTSILDMLPEFDRKLGPIPRNQQIAYANPPVNVPGVGDMLPVALPLTVAGVHPDVLAAMRPEWAALGFPHLSAAAGTGGSSDKQAPVRLEPGGSISVTLARGDISMSAIGTVTWVRGDRFVAFGHPFKGLGQLHLPVGSADVQWILASQQSSFKMANAFGDAGVLDQDRQPAVSGRMGPKAQMVPIDIVLTNRDRVQTSQNSGTEVWHVESTDQPMFFPLVVGMAMGTAVRVSEPIAENAAVTMVVRFDLPDGHAPVEITETMTGLQGSASVTDVSSLAQNAAKAIVFNGFERLRVERVSATLSLADDRNIAFLDSARTQSEEVDPEVPVAIQVTLQLANVGPQRVTLTLPPLPRELAGQTVTVQIGSEKAMPPELPEPANIRDYLNALRRQIPRNRLAAVLNLPEPTVLLRGVRLTQLPVGVRDELAGHTATYRTGKETLRTHVDTPWTLNGSLSIKLRVRQIP
jgi:hypothetical protein